MKSTGIVRKIDESGRVVIPIELRRTLDMDIGDSIGFYVEGGQLILKKHEPACVFCGEASKVYDFRGKKICKECLEQIREV